MKNEQIDYLKLNYPIELIRDLEQGGFFAAHPDLPGCAAQGETAEEAITNLDDARELWVESRVEQDLPVPLPLSEEPSGKILLRMARSLHAELAKHAARQGVSLNQLINYVLADFVGGAEYRTELSAFRQTVDEIKTLVSRTQQSNQRQAAQLLDPLITDDPGSQRLVFVSTFSQGWESFLQRPTRLPEMSKCYFDRRKEVPLLFGESENEGDI